MLNTSKDSMMPQACLQKLIRDFARVKPCHFILHASFQQQLKQKEEARLEKNIYLLFERLASSGIMGKPL